MPAPALDTNLSSSQIFERHILDPTRLGEAGRNLEAHLQKCFKGQPHIISKAVEMYQAAYVGAGRGRRPLSSALLLGPTGTGKTKLVEAMAGFLHDDEEHVLKVDCGEFQMEHEIAKLIGAPPGYLGHRETAPILSEAALTSFRSEDCDFTLILFDEIEKASRSFEHLLLGILDKGIIRLGDNSQVSFSKCMIFLTSNVGAEALDSFGKHGMHIFNPSLDLTDTGSDYEQAGVKAAKKRWKPEFLNRMDHILVYRHLGEEAVREISELILEELQKRLGENNLDIDFRFRLTPQAAEYVISKGSGREYGAREMIRCVQREIGLPLANLLASSQIGDFESVEIDYDGRQMQFVKYVAVRRPFMSAGG